MYKHKDPKVIIKKTMCVVRFCEGAKRRNQSHRSEGSALCHVKFLTAINNQRKRLDYSVAFGITAMSKFKITQISFHFDTNALSLDTQKHVTQLNILFKHLQGAKPVCNQRN